MGGDAAPDPQDVAGGLGAEPRPPQPPEDAETQTIKIHDEFVVAARALLARAIRDEQNRVKDDPTRWALGDLMIQMWPRRERTKEEASQIQKELRHFADEIDVNASMVKDWYYVAEQWLPESRVPEKSFAQHSKLRGRADKGWALLGINHGDPEDVEPFKDLNQAQIRKVEKVLQAIDQLDGESSAVLDAVIARLKPKPRGIARKIVAALRQREKQARRDADAARRRRSPLAIVFDYQAHLLSAAARVQALVEFVEDLPTQTARDYVRTVIEGALYVNQKALEDVLDALDAPEPTHGDVIDATSEEARKSKALLTAS